jgi:myosin-1
LPDAITQVTAGSQFRTALNELVAKLNACHPHYIRCIKPNENKRAFGYEESLVRHQVRYLGLLEKYVIRSLLLYG